MASLFRPHRLFSVLSSVGKTIPISQFNNIKSNQNKITNGVRGMARALTKEIAPQEDSIHNCLLTIESELMKKGRINQKLLSSIEELIVKEKPTSAQLLLLLKCCGAAAVEEKPDFRMSFANKLWAQARQKRINLDVSHYNSYLNIYLENEHPVLPLEFLKLMEEDGVKPNRVTFQNLITVCCQMGNLDEASKVLEVMKEQSLALNENIFSSLVLGHCIAKDFSGAEGILEIMKQKGLNKTPSIYGAYLTGLAASGNMKKFEEVLKECEENDMGVPVKYWLDIIYYTFLNGYNEKAVKFLDGVYDKKVDNLIVLALRLLQKKKYDAVFEVSRFLPDDGNTGQRMNIVLRYLGKYEDAEAIKIFLERYEKEGYTMDPKITILYSTLTNKLVDKSLQIINEMHKSGIKIKRIYFHPLLVTASTRNDVKSLLSIIGQMLGCDIRPLSQEFATMIFNNLFLGENQINIFLRTLIPLGLGAQSKIGYIQNCLSKMDFEGISKCWGDTYVPLNMSPFHKHIVACLINYHDPTATVNLLHSWAAARILGSDRLSSSEISKYGELPDENIESSYDEKNLDNYAVVERELSKIIQEVNNSLNLNRREHLTKILGSLVVKGLRISKEVGNEIIEKWNDEEITDLVNKATTVEFDGSEIHKKESLMNSRSAELQTFCKLCRKGQLEEAEKMLKEESLSQSELAYREFMVTLKNDEKLHKYLKEYMDKFSTEVTFNKNLNLESMLVQKGYYKEALKIMGMKGKIYLPEIIVLRSILKTILEKGSEEIIKTALDVTTTSGFKIIRKMDVIDMFGIGSEKLYEILSLANCDDLMLFCRSLEEIKMRKKHHVALEIASLFDSEKNFEDCAKLVFCYACIGDIKKGQVKLSNKSRVNFTADRYFGNITDMKTRSRIIENAIQILKDVDSLQKNLLFEKLIDCYINLNESPQCVLELWDTMQEQNVIPTTGFFHKLHNYLEKHGTLIPLSFEEGMKSQMNKQQSSPDLDFVPESVRDLIKEDVIREDFEFLIGKLVDAVENDIVTLSEIEETAIKRKNNTGSTDDLGRAFLRAAIDVHFSNISHNKDLYDFLFSKYGMTDTKRLENTVWQCMSRSIIRNEVFVSVGVSKMIVWAFFQQAEVDRRFTEILDPKIRELFSSQKRFIGFLKVVKELTDRDIFINACSEQVNVRERMKRIGVVPGLEELFRDVLRNRTKTIDEVPEILNEENLKTATEEKQTESAMKPAL